MFMLAKKGVSEHMPQNAVMYLFLVIYLVFWLVQHDFRRIHNLVVCYRLLGENFLPTLGISERPLSLKKCLPRNPPSAQKLQSSPPSIHQSDRSPHSAPPNNPARSPPGSPPHS